MQFHFRVANEADIPAIRELIAASVRRLHVQYTTEEREAAISTVFTVDTTLIADGTYFLAFAEDGRPAGCGGWSKRKTLYGGDHQVEEVKPEHLDSAHDAAKIRAIFVHPEFVRQGIGSALLERSEHAAIQAGFKRFEMGSTLAGVALYRLKRYEEVERIRVPVGPGLFIDVVRMVKEASTTSALTPEHAEA